MSIVNWKAFIRDAQSPTTPLTEASEPSWFGFTKKNILRQYRENEQNNDHTGNALMLVRLFGTPQEEALVQQLWNARQKEGGIDMNKWGPLMKKVNALHSKYYNQLTQLKSPQLKQTDVKCHECGHALTARERKANPSGVCDSCNLAARNAHDRARTFDEAKIVVPPDGLGEGVTTKEVDDLFDRIRAKGIHPADINTSSLKFEVGQAKRFGDSDIMLVINGKRVYLPMTDAELLLKSRAVMVSTLKRLATRY